MKQATYLSKYTIYLCLLVTATFILVEGDWNRDNKVIAADVVSYYAYLPATFIFDDIKLEKRETFDRGLFWPEPLPDGNQVIKTTMGMSILYAPFFFVAHGAVKLLGLEAYGYSAIYKAGLLLSSFVYLIIGLVFLRKILQRYFSDKIVALTLLAITLGTNLLHYASREATMTHVYNFALINLFVYLTLIWYEKQTLSRLIILGFLSGLIALIRPSNILILGFFFLYGVQSKDTFSSRIKLVFNKFHWFVIMGLAFFVVWVPQIIYWWSVTGDYFVNSYPDERFYWGNPHFIDGFFSYRKGWLVYTPLMVFALAGIPLLFKRLKEFSWSILAFMLLATYVIVAWWCWWYGGSFGMRSFVDYYGILAIPMASLFNEIVEHWKKPVLIVVAIVGLGITQNIFFMEKYKRGSLHYDSTSKASFFHSFWHKSPQQGYWELLEKPDYQKALEGIDAVVKEND